MIRRHFLMSAAARPLAFAASDTLRVACVGLRGRGRDHMEAFTSLPGVEVPALCDVDATVLLRAAAYFEARTGSRPQLYSDLRKLLEDRSIDAVALATPDHWHTLQTIWCCQAGKDVLVEKPCSHNMFEARQIVAAARRY
ncbi:MAG: Gfo/Idh/MocA family oxidoreductase [Acidobacteria bacterium]|nr:Gfo/Idh/MocA family oxidoreductase [Acidobacteriota bacterium]